MGSEQMKLVVFTPVGHEAAIVDAFLDDPTGPWAGLPPVE